LNFAGHNPSLFFANNEKHEAIQHFRNTTVKETLFSDFKGEIKAWAPGA
jgi:hypothetical protein